MAIITGQPMDYYHGLQAANAASQGLPSQFYSDDFATNTFTQILRDQYDFYKQAYRPAEDYLRSQVYNPVEEAKSIAEARELSVGAVDRAQREYERRLQGYGVPLTPQQRAQSNHDFALQRSLAEVDAANSTRSAIRDRNLLLAGGGGLSTIPATRGLQQMAGRV